MSKGGGKQIFEFITISTRGGDDTLPCDPLKSTACEYYTRNMAQIKLPVWLHSARGTVNGNITNNYYCLNAETGLFVNIAVYI